MESNNKQPVRAQVVQMAGKKSPQSAGEMMPCLLHEAPSTFRAHGFSIERTRKALGVTRRVALEMVLAGLVLSSDDRPANTLRLRRLA